MTKDETVQLLMLMSAAYPTFRPEDKQATSNMWHLMLKDYSFTQVQVAFKSYVATSSSAFAPSISQIIDEIHRADTMFAPSESEMWSRVYQAICNSSYNAVTEYNDLPSICQKAVGSPQILKEWSRMDIETVNSVVQSNFLKSYRTEVKRQTDLAKMPNDIKQLLLQTSERLGIDKE